MSPPTRETLISWTLRLGFALVGGLSLYLLVRWPIDRQRYAMIDSRDP